MSAIEKKKPHRAVPGYVQLQAEEFKAARKALATQMLKLKYGEIENVAHMAARR